MEQCGRISAGLNNKRHNHTGAIAALVAGFALVGCGGDSGGSTVIIDEQISFSVSGSFSVVEETSESAAVTTASANGAPVTVRIQNSDDGAAFAVENGEIVPRGRLDFEAPTDANADNVYDFTLVAESSGLTSITRQVQVTVRNDPADDIIKLTTGMEDDFFAIGSAFFGDGEVSFTVTGPSSCSPNSLALSWAVIIDPDAVPGVSDRELIVSDLPDNAITRLVSRSFANAPCTTFGFNIASGSYVQNAMTTEVLSVGHLLGPPFAGPGLSVDARAAVFADSVSAAGPDVELDAPPVPGVLQTTFENMAAQDEIAPAVFADLDNDGLDEAVDAGIGDDGVGGARYEIRVLDGRQVRFDVTSFLDAAVGDPGRTDVIFPSNNVTLFQDRGMRLGRDFNGDGALDVLSSYHGSITGAAGDAGAASFVILFGDQILARGPGEVDFASLTGVERAIVEVTGLTNRTNPEERESFDLVGTEDLNGDGVPELLFIRDPASLGALFADVPLSERRSLFILDGAAVRDAPDRVLRADGLDGLPLARLEFDTIEDSSFGGLSRLEGAALLGDLTGDGTAEILVTVSTPPPLTLTNVFIVSGGAIDPAPGAVTLQTALSGAIAGVDARPPSGGPPRVPDRFNPLSDETLVLSDISAPAGGGSATSFQSAFIIPALRVRQTMAARGEIDLSGIGD